MLDAILAAVREASDGGRFADDVTLVTLELEDEAAHA